MLLPTAATTTTPLPCAQPIACASSGENASRSGSRGSRKPPRLMLITRAPLSTAHLIAFTSASTSIRSLSSTTFAIRSSAEEAEPAIPTELLTPAAIRPATNVPWPSSSTRAEPPTNVFASAILPAKSGWSPSIPESITATRTAASGVGVSQKSNVRLNSRCHCFDREQVVRDVGGAARAEPFDVGRAREVAQPRRRRALDDERRDRRQALRVRERGPEAGQVGRRRRADRVAGRARPAARARPQRRGRARAASSQLDLAREALGEALRRRDASPVAPRLVEHERVLALDARRRRARRVAHSPSLSTLQLDGRSRVRAA